MQNVPICNICNLVHCTCFCNRIKVYFLFKTFSLLLQSLVHSIYFHVCSFVCSLFLVHCSLFTVHTMYSCIILRTCRIRRHQPLKTSFHLFIQISIYFKAQQNHDDVMAIILPNIMENGLINFEPEHPKQIQKRNIERKKENDNIKWKHWKLETLWALHFAFKMFAFTLLLMKLLTGILHSVYVMLYVCMFIKSGKNLAN